MCDLLKKSAMAYQTLSGYEYTLICGRKGIQTQVLIRFPNNAYHHLAGFQYSRLEALKEQKSALQTVLSNSVTYEQLIASGFQHSDRLESIVRLQECLETNQFVFRYHSYHHPFSKIEAEYLMLFDEIVFFTEDETPVSIFKNFNNVDYRKGSAQLTVLQVIRTCLKTGEKVVTYQRDGFSA